MTKMIDAHCHAWDYWPYQPPVPDPESRGTAAQLVFQMTQNGVDEAFVVCAEIDHNPANNAYVAQQAAQDPRLHVVVDVDSMWKPSYHQPGAAERLQAAVDQYQPVGFTHYLKAEDDGAWLYSAEGLAFLRVASEHRLIVSLSCHPHHVPAIRRAAEQFPDMPFLLHHLGHLKVSEPGNWPLVLDAAATPNICVKVSGFYYATAGAWWDYPQRDVLPLVRAIYDRFGAQRLCWGSDYPVSGQFITYRQALEKFRTYCDFIPADDQAWVLGGTLAGLLAARGR